MMNNRSDRYIKEFLESLNKTEAEQNEIINAINILSVGARFKEDSLKLTRIMQDLNAEMELLHIFENVIKNENNINILIDTLLFRLNLHIEETNKVIEDARLLTIKRINNPSQVQQNDLVACYDFSLLSSLEETKKYLIGCKYLIALEKEIDKVYYLNEYPDNLNQYNNCHLFIENPVGLIYVENNKAHNLTLNYPKVLPILMQCKVSANPDKGHLSLKHNPNLFNNVWNLISANNLPDISHGKVPKTEMLSKESSSTIKRELLNSIAFKKEILAQVKKETFELISIQTKYETEIQELRLLQQKIEEIKLLDDKILQLKNNNKNHYKL